MTQLTPDSVARHMTAYRRIATIISAMLVSERDPRRIETFMRPYVQHKDAIMHLVSEMSDLEDQDLYNLGLHMVPNHLLLRSLLKQSPYSFQIDSNAEKVAQYLTEELLNYDNRQPSPV